MAIAWSVCVKKRCDPNVFQADSSSAADGWKMRFLGGRTNDPFSGSFAEIDTPGGRRRGMQGGRHLPGCDEGGAPDADEAQPWLAFAAEEAG